MHLAIAVAEHAAAAAAATQAPCTTTRDCFSKSDRLPSPNDSHMFGDQTPKYDVSRSISRRSLPEFIYPDTIRQRVTPDECPVCQIMLPKGPNGCEIFEVVWCVLVERKRYVGQEYGV
ncbi:unnamed protein product [Anisakis simplex]|uniref:Uncharacterized protein n=1 Tax=Anisakis simplex TaxID=6269 RepID=A0A3P6PVD8_ANISI|nr:unnamed protein product [Anisakis simplex]